MIKNSLELHKGCITTNNWKKEKAEKGREKEENNKRWVIQETLRSKKRNRKEEFESHRRYILMSK